MPMKINSATNKSQLQEYALNELGIKLDKDALERDEMIAAIREAEGSTPSAADLATAPAATQDDEDDDAPVGSIEALVKKEKKLKIHEITDFTRCRATVIISPLQPHDEEAEPDTHAVIGANGVFYQLETGVEHDVPYSVYDVLKNSKRTTYFSKKNPLTGHTETHSKEVLRWPHTLVSVTVIAAE